MCVSLCHTLKSYLLLSPFLDYFVVIGPQCDEEGNLTLAPPEEQSSFCSDYPPVDFDDSDSAPLTGDPLKMVYSSAILDRYPIVDRPDIK